MSLIKLSKIENFSSENKKYPAKNLLKDNELSWKCNHWTEYSWIILELSQKSLIDSITIQNNSSAFIEIFISDNPDCNFQVLLPAFSSQSPAHSEALKNCTKKFEFSAKDFTSAKNYSCKFIKCVCSQPYNKKTKYGLCNLKIYGNKYAFVEKEKKTTESINLGNFKWKSQTLGFRLSWKKIDLEQKKKTFNEQNNNKNTPLESDESIVRKSNSTLRSSKYEQIINNHNLQVNNVSKDENFPSTSAKVSTTKTAIKRKAEEKSNISVKKQIKKPFEQLMSGVVFVLSGYGNPHRSELKRKAMEMGARYEPKWNPNCTHLVCAFPSTPKYKEVDRLKGKICTHKWIEDSYDKKQYLSCKKYRLTKRDDDTDSDDDDENEKDKVGDSGIHEKKDQLNPSRKTYKTNNNNRIKKEKNNNNKNYTDTIYDSDVIYDMETESEDEDNNGTTIDSTI